MSMEIRTPAPAWVVEERINALRSDRKVRPVVTPQGHRARGKFPSLKGFETRFESLVENDSLRIFEVAKSVLKVQTHPFVLRLMAPCGKSIHYTPDAFLTMAHTAVVAEIKGDWLLKLAPSRQSLCRILRASRDHGVPLALLTETEVRPFGLQDELKLLLRERPACNRRHQGMDPTEWDPAGRSTPSDSMLRRWREAQAACDALLDRVIRRSPDEVIDSLEVE